MRRLLVMGSAPCLEQDLQGLDLGAYDVAVVNRAGLRFLGFALWWVTYHADVMVQEEWTQARAAAGGLGGYFVVVQHRNRWLEKLGLPIVHTAAPSTSGSSTLLAVLFGLEAQGYDAVLVAGAPLEGEYAGYQAGWIEKKRVLAGRVRSLSGWTKSFLEAL